MAGPFSRYRCISEAATTETSLMGDTHTAPLNSQSLTMTVVTDRACTVALQVLDDNGSWSEVESESPAVGTNAYTYNGNYSTVRPVASVGSSSAWAVQVYLKAN